MALRVLLLNEFFYPDEFGGTATATTNIARHLADDHGCQVHVVCHHSSYRDPDVTYSAFEKMGNVSITRVACPNWLRENKIKRLLGNILFARECAKAAAKLGKFDVCLVTTAPLTLPMAARTLKRKLGIPYAYLLYDVDPERSMVLGLTTKGAKAERLLRAWQTKFLKDSARIVAIGRCMKELVAKAYGESLDKIDVIPVGAKKQEQFEYGAETKFRNANGLQGFVALYSGNFGMYHDFDTLLASAQRLQELGSNVTFALVGNGHKKGYIEGEIAKRGLKNVRMFGFVAEEDLADMLGSANVHLVTLEAGMEGLCVPSKFYTCLASGRPVIALMNQGTEVDLAINEANCGTRIAVGDAHGLTECLLEMERQPQLSADMGHKAKQAFDAKYEISKVVELWFETLSRASKGA